MISPNRNLKVQMETECWQPLNFRFQIVPKGETVWNLSWQDAAHTIATGVLQGSRKSKYSYFPQYCNMFYRLVAKVRAKVKAEKERESASSAGPFIIVCTLFQMINFLFVKNLSSKKFDNVPFIQQTLKHSLPWLLSSSLLLPRSVVTLQQMTNKTIKDIFTGTIIMRLKQL